MKLRLRIALPDSIGIQDALRQKNMPCFCRIKGSVFQMVFQEPLFDSEGTVEEWVQEVIDRRAPAGAGGEYTHHCYGMVSLKNLEENFFEITDLSFFKNPFGWCQILMDGNLTQEKIWNSPQELEDIEKMEETLRNKKLSKKQKITIDALKKLDL